MARIPQVQVVRGQPGERPELLTARAFAPLTDSLPRPRAGKQGGGRTSDRAVVLVAVSPPAPPAPAVVHELLDLLAEAGWTEIDVGAVVTTWDRDRGHHDVGELVRAAGLLGVTRRGLRYQVADLREDSEPADVAPRSVLHGRPVSALWQRAGLRVLVSRNVTDPFDGYALGLTLLTGVAEPIPGARAQDVAVDLVRDLPPQLSVVDASVSSHGVAGDLALSPNPTDTVIAGNDVLLTDVTAAQLQGIDPAASRSVSAALAELPLPEAAEVSGDLTPYVGWQPGHPLLRAMAQQLDESPGLARVLALLVGDAESPDPVLRRLRATLAPVLERWDRPGPRAWMAGAGYSVASVAGLLRGWQAVLGKGAVERVVRPLGFDPAVVDEREFDALPDLVAGFERRLDGVPAGPDGLRWRTVEGATVFEVSRLVPARYDEWVARVDVSRGIGMMADYLGGRVVVLTTDEEGRPVRQAERNVYLPQPNYLALYGGKPIDVAKIEVVERADDRCRLLWRTVVSPNGSATYDDGALSFVAEGDSTRVSVCGRQLFSLPTYWEAADLARFPELRDPLVEDAYRRFFSTTFDNLEACFEGREYRIGRPPAHPDAPLPTAMLTMGLELAREWLDERGGVAGAAEGIWPGARGPAAGRLDADGFRHFPGDLAP